MKRKAVFILIIMLPLIAVGCNGGGDNGNPVMVPVPEVLNGTFDLQQVRVQDTGIDVTLKPPAVTGKVVVTEDGRFTATLSIPSEGFSGTWSGSYTISGNTLTLNYDDGTVEVWNISDDRTVVSGTFAEGSTTVTPTYALA